MSVADSTRPVTGLRSPTAGGSAARASAVESAAPRRAVLPERYALREKDDVRFLVCDEAPRLRLIVDPEMAVSASEAASLGERVILLDGAGQFGPLIDNDRKLYNLDHHAGCERLFTLSTCEQALLLVHSGLELSEGDWTIYANDPDLDTVLAIWCLLNHRRVRELREEARDLLMPLFRLEGAIDANGRDLARLCGLTTAQLEKSQRRIDDLLVRERGMKQTGSWATKNVHAYTLDMLRAIDGLVYTHEDFGDFTRIEEVYGHVEVAPRRVAVACRDSAGIYTVEQHLKTRWGDQLSIIALENQPGQYTLRRLSSVAGPELGPAYEMLNRADAAVDGRPPGKRWGGSSDIGGSPRPQGTQLPADQVLELLARAYRPTTWWIRTRRLGASFGVGLSFLVFLPMASLFPSLSSLLGLSPRLAEACEVSIVCLLALAVGGLATRAASQGRPWVFGWRVPANGGGWWLSSLALLGALPVGAWAFARPGTGLVEFLAVLGASALGVAAVEVWFRGLVHGLLVMDFPTQRPGGPWLLSRAALTSSGAYAAVATVLAAPLLGSPRLAPLGASGLELAGATAALTFAVGLALSMIRERSLSLLPGIAIQLAGVLAAATLWIALG